MEIRSAIIPAAGLGTRFLPITKSIPKEMLPILNKPALQYVVEEGITANINHFCMIVSEKKNAIKEYFSNDQTLNDHLATHNKEQYLQELNTIIAHNKFSYANQPFMGGLGHAILMGKEIVLNDDFFAVMLPDDILFGQHAAIKQLRDVTMRYNASAIAVMRVPKNEIGHYGCIKIKKQVSNKLMLVDDIIEKPKPEEAYSEYAIIGRYIFSRAIFNELEQTNPSANGEIQLTDAITALIKNGHQVYAFELDAMRFDTGRPEGWLAVNNYLGNVGNR